MEASRNGGSPTSAMRFDPVGYCVYCDASESKDGTPLTDEHIIPEGMGGILVLPRSSCAECAAVTTRFERHFMRDMYGPVRAVMDLYGKRRKATRPTTLPFRLDSNTNTVQVDVSDYPFTLAMPLLDAPGMVIGRRTPSALPDLRGPGRIWRWQTPHAEQQTRQLMAKYGSRRGGTTQNIYLTDFLKLIAKVAHCFVIATHGYQRGVRYLLRSLILAPSGQATVGATYLVGGAQNLNGTRVQHQSPDKIYDLNLMVYTKGNLMEQTITARVQFFTWLGAPVYEAVVHTWPPLIG